MKKLKEVFLGVFLLIAVQLFEWSQQEVEMPPKWNTRCTVATILAVIVILVNLYIAWRRYGRPH